MRPPRLPRPAWPAAGAVALGALGVLLGLRPADAALVGAVTLVLMTAYLALPAAADDPWPPDRRDDRAGTRSDLSALTWTFIGRDGRVSEAAVRRLRVLATDRLARAGLPVPGGVGPLRRDAPPDPARDEARERARAVLGERAWSALTASGRLPSLAEVAHCVGVVEGLGPPAPTGAPGAPPPAAPPGASPAPPAPPPQDRPTHRRTLP